MGQPYRSLDYQLSNYIILHNYFFCTIILDKILYNKSNFKFIYIFDDLLLMRMCSHSWFLRATTSNWTLIFYFWRWTWNLRSWCLTSTRHGARRWKLFAPTRTWFVYYFLRTALLPWAVDGKPSSFGHELLPDDFHKITDSIEFAYKRIPVLERAGVK